MSDVDLLKKLQYKVSLISPDQVDEQVIDWLKQAYTDA